MGFKFVLEFVMVVFKNGVEVGCVYCFKMFVEKFWEFVGGVFGVVFIMYLFVKFVG